MRKVETQESYAGSKIVLPEAVREQIASQQVEIVKVGADPICEDTDCERPHYRHFSLDRLHVFHGKPGDWAVIAPRSLTESGEDGLYLVPQDDVLAILSTA